MPPEFCVESGEVAIGDYDRCKSSKHWKADRVPDFEAPKAAEIEFPLPKDSDEHDCPKVDGENEKSYQSWMKLPEERNKSPEISRRQISTSVLLETWVVNVLRAPTEANALNQINHRL